MNFLEFEIFCQKNDLKIFTLEDIKILFNRYSSSYLRLKINRWKQKGYISTLKRGVFVFSDLKPDEFQISAKLIIPSYISLETALSNYSIIPEVSAKVLAITTKNTRRFYIDKITYNFVHIKNSLFTDFVNLREDIFIATPEKAVLDYFYFRNPHQEDQFFERLNKEILKKIDLKKMEKLSRKFPFYVQKSFNLLRNVILK